MIVRNAGALARALRLVLGCRRGPAVLAVTVAPGLTILAACGGQQAPSVALPAHASAPSTVPVAPSSAPATPQQAVATAYAGYWQAYAQAMTAGSAPGARAILSPYASPALTARLISALRPVWAAGDAAYGQAVTHPLSVQITGTTALLHDCLDLSHLGAENRTTGLVLPDSFGLSNRDYYVTLVLTGGRWLVSNMEPVEVPCQP
jgi:hypothetical protein